MLFSDESCFCFRPDGVDSVRRRPEEEYKKDCVTPAAKQSGGGIMIWGCFSVRGVGQLYEVNGNIYAKYYLKIVKKLPFLQDSIYMVESFIFSSILMLLSTLPT